MTRVASRQLRNETRKVLDLVETGEEVTITVDGRDVAVLRPIPSKKRWVDAKMLLSRLALVQADPQLSRDLEELANGTTDEQDDLLG